MKKLSRIEECRIITEHLTNKIKMFREDDIPSKTNSLIGAWCKYQEEMLEIEEVEAKRINDKLSKMKERIDRIEKDMPDIVIDEISDRLQGAYCK